MIAHSTSKRSQLAAVAYYRASSDKQETSVPEQRRAVEKFAAANCYRIEREYVDDGVSGWKDTRDGFQRLIGDLDRGGFQAVLCWDQNRFSRFPVLEANHYWYLLDRAGVHLATVNQGRLDWSSIAGWLTASIKQHADAQHRHQLSADVKRGKRARAERGEWQGKVPFGFALDAEHKLTPGDENEVSAVRRIYAAYIGGKSLRHVAHELNASGQRTRRGGDWSPTTIRNILSSPAYSGTYVHGEVTIEGNHPALVDAATFRTVERLLAERQPKTTPFMGGGGYLFTGLIRCGACGSSMCGRTGNSGTRAYHCLGFTHKGICERNTVVQAELAEIVVDTIVEAFTAPEAVEQLRLELRRRVKGNTSKASAERIRKQVATVEGKLAKAKRRLVEVDSDMLPVVQEQIRNLDRQRLDLHAALKAAQTPQDAALAEADRKVDTALALFERLRQALHDADSVHLRELLRETIERIEVWTDKRAHGTLSRFDLARGVIHTRGANLFHSPTRSR